MTITPLEMESSIVVESPVAGATTTTEDLVAGTELADLLDDEAIAVLAARAREQAAEGGLKLLGSDGLLKGITKRIIEAALEAELADHLDGPGQGSNERNGRRAKRVATEVGPIEVIVPRDRSGSFAPGVVRRSARRTSGIDEMVISLVGKGLTTGEVAAHLISDSLRKPVGGSMDQPGSSVCVRFQAQAQEISSRLCSIEPWFVLRAQAREP